MLAQLTATLNVVHARKNGLECSPACGLCKRESCPNSSAPDFDKLKGMMTMKPIESFNN